MPGRLVVHHVPGHTPGSIAVHAPERGVLFTGDALVTQDMASLARGPRVMDRSLTYDTRLAFESLAVLERINARLILPGHGEPWHGSPAQAVAIARDRADKKQPTHQPGHTRMRHMPAPTRHRSFERIGT